MVLSKALVQLYLLYSLFTTGIRSILVLWEFYRLILRMEDIALYRKDLQGVKVTVLWHLQLACQAVPACSQDVYSTGKFTGGMSATYSYICVRKLQNV